MKYLTLIRAIALLHQHQRPQKTAITKGGEELPYIEVTRQDIVLANRLSTPCSAAPSMSCRPARGACSG